MCKRKQDLNREKPRRKTSNDWIQVSQGLDVCPEVSKVLTLSQGPQSHKVNLTSADIRQPKSITSGLIGKQGFDRFSSSG
jgi:hypothetical protein